MYPLLLNPTQAAELVERLTGRSCSRANITRLAERGRLPLSSTKNEKGVYRFKAELLIDEYETNVGKSQVGVQQPHRQRPITPPSEPESPKIQESRPIRPEYQEIPDYNESRARAEYEKANILEMDRKKKEGELLDRAEVLKAWSDAVNASKTKLLALPTMAKQRIPHLDLEEIEILTELVREALEALASESEE